MRIRSGGLVRGIFALAAVVAILLGAAATLTGTTYATVERGGGCYCPMVYAPVVCDNGRTYSNLCVAHCHGATGCVPIGGPLPF